MAKLSQLFLVIFFVKFGQTAFIKNKYKIDIENVQLCPNNEEMVNPIRNVKLSSYNRTHKALSYDFAYDRPIDENIGGSVILEVWKDGVWKVIPFMDVMENACEHVLGLFKDSWITYHKNAGVEHPEQCPIPAGQYHLNNYVMETNYISVPFWAGRFRITVEYVDMRTKENLQCFMYITRITEIL